MDLSDCSEVRKAVNEHLDTLQPTKKLLEFYRSKLLEYEQDHENIFRSLKAFQKTYTTQNQLEKDLQNRDEELSTLREALSDLQACLLHEREHVLRLYADNDRLKIREVEDRRKIQHLLCLCKKQYPNADLECFTTDQLPEDCKTGFPRKTTVKGPGKPKGSTVASVMEDKVPHPLTFQVEALRAQLEDQSRLSRESISALTEDNRLIRQEGKNQRIRDAEKISTLSHQWKCSQDLLHKMTKDYLSAQQSHRRQEQAWLAQRDRMALKIDSFRRSLQQQHLQKHSFSSPSLQRSTSAPVDQPNFEVPSVRTKKPAVPSNSKFLLESLQKELDQCKQQIGNFRSQCLRLEENNTLLREEKDAASKLYNDRCESLLSRLKLLSGRYSDLEKRFKLQMEGYRNDIRILRKQLQTIERQCLKAALRLTEEDSDVLMLQQVHRNTVESKDIFDTLRSLKAEIYQLEEDLKHLR